MDYAAIARKIRIAIFDDAEARGRVLQDSMESVIERELRTAIVMEEKCSPKPEVEFWHGVNLMNIGPGEQPNPHSHHMGASWPMSDPVTVEAAASRQQIIRAVHAAETKKV